MFLLGSAKKSIQKPSGSKSCLLIDLKGSKNKTLGVCNLQSHIIKSKLKTSSDRTSYLYNAILSSDNVAYLAAITTALINNANHIKATSVNVIILSWNQKYDIPPIIEPNHNKN